MSTETTVLTQRQAVPTAEPAKTQRPESRKEIAKRRLLRWQSLEAWQQVDSEVLNGYRKATPSLLGCIKSWFYLHNESVNILSHLGGATFFVSLAVGLYIEAGRRYTSWSNADVAACAVFIFGVATCFGLSALFHTCAAHSSYGYNLARQLDFQGIVILVVSTSSPQVYYTFYEEAPLRNQYWALIVFFAVLASSVTFIPMFHRPEGHAVRVAVFAGLGFSTFAPIVHGIFLHGWEGQSERFPLWSVGLTHTFNILGAIVYVLHFPERYWPGKFDIFGASHQLMHCAIIGAALMLLIGTVVSFDKAAQRSQQQQQWRLKWW